MLNQPAAPTTDCLSAADVA